MVMATTNHLNPKMLLRIAALLSLTAFSLLALQAARKRLRSSTGESLRVVNHVKSPGGNEPADDNSVVDWGEDKVGGTVTVHQTSEHFSGHINGDDHCYLEGGDYVFRADYNLHGIVGRSDNISLGRCRYHYPVRCPPANGYLNEVDYFFFRDAHTRREECFLHCIELLERTEVNSTLLTEASVMGLTEVVKKMVTEFKIDPLFAPPRTKSDRSSKIRGLNAIQEAIRGGYAEIVKVLTNSDNNLVIDEFGRTVADYIQMKASPIRPADAESVLGLRVDSSESMTSKEKERSIIRGQEDSTAGSTESSTMGWSQHTSFHLEETCDIDILYDDMPRSVFFKEYFSTGRPFLLRRRIQNAEMEAFSKSRWDSTTRFHTEKPVKVGPTAYPFNTGQRHCSYKMTTLEIENGTKCNDMPDVSMVHAFHPMQVHFNELYPMYMGDVFDKSSGWRMIEDWFGSPREEKLAWQVFWGGDGSGATYHWHNTAYNVLYVGTKEWRLAPPLYRGVTGMPAEKAMGLLDDSVTLRCTQFAGDIMYIPNFWGHLTFNHGFTIGAAAILPYDYQRYDDGESEVGLMSDDMPPGFSDTGGSKSNIPNTKKSTGIRHHGDIPFLFVHINKTGGTSIIDMLRKKCKSLYISERWVIHGTHHRSFHATARSYIDHYGRDVWNNAYTFAVVRHPLARQVSNFFFLVNQCRSKRNMDVCRERRIPMSMIHDGTDSLSEEAKIMAFHEWIWELYQAYPPGSSNHYIFGSHGHGNEDSPLFNCTQTSWVVDDSDTIVVNDIFHFENLTKDMRTLSESIECLNNADDKTDSIGVSDERNDKQAVHHVESKDETVEMEHLNAAPAYPDFMLFAKNEITKKIIEEVYAADFRNFGYEL